MSTIQILIRSSLTDTGELPRSGDVSNSPDVIPYQTLVEDPIGFFIGNYDENVNQELLATKDNFIYARGKNLASTLQQGDIYMYYSLDSKLNDPASWTKNQLQTKDGKLFATVNAQSQGNIVVTEMPFVWVPPDPQSGETYSLIGVIVPKGTKPTFKQLLFNFEKYVEEHNTIGWTKVTIKKPIPPPIPDRKWKTTFAYSQGATARQMRFDLQCKNIPSGSYISFVSDNNDGPNPPILLDKTQVSDPNGSYGIASQVPADYKCNISFEFMYKGTAPLDSSVKFIAYYYEGSGSGPQKPVVIASVTTAN
jgi:hypothetical protein